MCRKTHSGCKCRQAAELRAQAAERATATAEAAATLPGRRLYERLPGWRLELLATHWPPTPRSRARADATTVPATATEPAWRSRPSAYYQLEMISRCGGRSRGQGLQLAAHKPGRLGGQSPGHQLLLPGRAQSHKSPARKSCGFACERVSACILCARQVIKTIWWRNARSVQYTAVYCSILRCLGIFSLFFGHSRLLGRCWSRR